MKRFFFFLFLFATQLLSGQIKTVSLAQAIARPPLMVVSPVHPVNKSELTQNQIMFDYPEEKGAITYVVTVFKISKNSVNGETKSDTVPVFSQRDSTTATLIVDFEFGSDYLWYYSAFDKTGKEIKRSVDFAFSILPLPENYRVHVVKNDKKGQGGLISFDFAQLICDRNGKVVWFQKTIPGEFSRDGLIRDLKMTPAGTLTFITTKNVFETSLDGRILFKGPDPNLFTKGTKDFYHHGFDRLPSGNYLTMGTHHELRSVPGDTAHVLVEYGTLLEFNRFGKVVWSWDSKTYLTDAKLFHNKLPDGKFDTDSHLNAVTQDDSSKYIYAGFRNLNTIIKIDKATGKVVSEYNDGFFWHQYGATLFPDGSIGVFNNDSIADPKKTSSVVIFSQPKNPGEKSKILWKYSCKFDTLSDGKSERDGNIDLLPNGDYLVNMGTLHRTIEINKNKKLLWDAFVEEYAAPAKMWVPVRQYRAHYISSLYPCYYTATAIVDTISADKKITVIINNEGTEPDSYYIDSKTNTEPYSNTAEAVSVAEERSGKFNIPSAQNGKRITEIRIRSVVNPDFVRIISL
jgi:hypothetical protein